MFPVEIKVPTLLMVRIHLLDNGNIVPVALVLVGMHAKVNRVELEDLVAFVASLAAEARRAAHHWPRQALGHALGAARGGGGEREEPGRHLDLAEGAEVLGVHCGGFCFLGWFVLSAFEAVLYVYSRVWRLARGVRVVLSGDCLRLGN